MITEFVSLEDEESGRTLGVLLMSLGRKNERFNMKTTTTSSILGTLDLTTRSQEDSKPNGEKTFGVLVEPPARQKTTAIIIRLRSIKNRCMQQQQSSVDTRA